MNVYKCNIFDFLGSVDAICITTNGCINNGKAVMGAGIAKEAKYSFNGIDKKLGNIIKNYGNHVHVIQEYENTKIISFPTKHGMIKNSKDLNFVNEKYKFKYKNYDEIPGWVLKSDIELIKQSCNELKELCDINEYKSVLLPKPGCSNGGLEWSFVNRIIEPLLGINIFIVDKGDEIWN